MIVFFFFELITNVQCSAGAERSNPCWNFPPFPYACFQASPEEEFKWGDGKKIDFWKGLRRRNSESEEMGKSAKQLTAETPGSVPSRADCEPLKNIKPLFPESYDWARLQWPWKEMLQCNAALNEKLKKESLGRRLWSTTLRPAAVMLILRFKQSCTAERKYFWIPSVMRMCSWNAKVCPFPPPPTPPPPPSMEKECGERAIPEKTFGGAQNCCPLKLMSFT